MKEQFKKLKARLQREANQEETPKNEDVDQEREKVLKEGRSFIKPLALNRRQAIMITSLIAGGLLVSALILFGILIYRYQSDSNLVYRISQIIPYPAAKVNGGFIMYDDYLFELRSLKRYYENPVGAASATREAIDFSTPEGQEQLKELQKISFNEAKKKLIIKQLAKENNISVSRQELDDAINEYAQSEGGEEKLAEAIQYFYGWNMSDFRQVLKIQLLQQKLPKAFSEDKRKLAEEILAKARNGEDFTKLAKEHSNDTASQQEGGDLGFVNEQTQFVTEFKDAALKLEPGQVSDIVETQFGYHVIKGTERNDKGEIRVAHILVQYEDIQSIIQQRIESAQTTNYIEVSTDTQPDQTEQPAA